MFNKIIKRVIGFITISLIAISSAAFGSLVGTAMGTKTNIATTAEIIQAELTHCRSQQVEGTTACIFSLKRGDINAHQELRQ